MEDFASNEYMEINKNLTYLQICFNKRECSTMHAAQGQCICKGVATLKGCILLKKDIFNNGTVSKLMSFFYISILRSSSTRFFFSHT